MASGYPISVSLRRLGGARAAGALAVIAALAALALVVALGGLPDGVFGPSGPPTSAPSTSPTSPVGPSGSPTAGGSAAPSGEPVAEPVVLVGAGDIADCRLDGDSATAGLLDGIEGTVFTLGDNAYERGTRQEFEDCYGPTWGRHLERTWPSSGNHEYGTAGAAGYFGYFGERAGDPAKGYYAYDLGAWRVYALNSNCGVVRCGEASAQVAWLKDDLAANPRRCTLAYWHHPRYSSGRHGSDPSTDVLWDVLYEAGAEIVLAGHDHSYERFAPMSRTGDPDPDRGIVSFVVGTGGRDLYEFGDVLPTSISRDSATWGVLELTLFAASWSSRFVPVAGKTFTDAASGACH